MRKQFLIISTIILFFFPCLLYSENFSFSEDFSSWTNIDTSATSSTTMLDTTNHFAKLPYISSFTDLSVSGATITNYFGTSNINTLGYSITKWLIGGDYYYDIDTITYHPRIVSYNGSSFTDLSGTIYDFGNANINSLLWGGSYYLIGGGGYYCGPKLNKYDFSTYTIATSVLTNYSHLVDHPSPPPDHDSVPDSINILMYNGSYWLIGGDNGKLNRWDGVTIAPCTDLSTAATFITDGTHSTGYAISSIGWNGSYWLIGGANGQMRKYDGTSWTNLTTDFSFGTSQIYSIAWNNSYWLVGGADGKLTKYDGTVATSLTALTTSAGGNFGGNTVYSMVWNGYDWYIVGSGGKFVKYDGAGIADSNFIGLGDGPTGPPQTMLDASWGTNTIKSIGWNGTYLLFGGNTAKINRADGIYNGATPVSIVSKKISSTAERIYKATLTATEELNGQTLKYYLTANAGTNWKEFSNGVESTITYTASDLRWKAELTGTWKTPKIKNLLTVNYTTCDQSIIPANLAGDVTSLSDTETKITVLPETTNVNTQYSLINDNNPPTSLISPTNVIVAYDITAKNFDTNEIIEKFNKALTVTIHWQSGDGTYVNSTNNSVLLSNAKTQLTIAFWNGLHWVPLSSNVTVNGNNIYVSTKTLHLSKFGIIIGSPTNISVNCEPNPFTPLSCNSTFNKVKISFPNANNETVSFKIWDITGTLMKEINNTDGISSFEWDGKDEQGRVVESGVYIYEIKVGGSSAGKGTLVVAK
ncbi:MAG: T9SS type A sorting domain-containing protein [Candidatus Firestonebacteria bacterium]